MAEAEHVVSGLFGAYRTNPDALPSDWFATAPEREVQDLCPPRLPTSSPG